jgi:hypothetical protein
VVCAFDVAHVTGFNAVTQARGKFVDVKSVQSIDYTMELIATVRKNLKECKGPSVKRASEQDIYCVMMHGYSAGKPYGRRYLRGEAM